MDHRWRAWWAWLPWKFLSLDAGGAFAWAGNYVLLGWLFRTQLETLTAGMARFSALFGALIGLALAAYVTAKVIQRRRIYRTLMVATITPGELKRRMDARENLVILDLRTLDERREGRIPGSLQFDQDKLSSILPEMPQAEVILYSSSPNKVENARAALQLKRGGRKARPASGGRIRGLAQPGSACGTIGRAGWADLEHSRRAGTMPSGRQSQSAGSVPVRRI